MSAKNKVAPKPGTKGFQLVVLPSRDSLEEAVAANGQCHPRRCWHYVAINKLMEQWEPGAKHYVRVDAGHIKLNYQGWRYIADTPLHVKRSLMLFDLGRYDEVHVREYSLRFRRTTKVTGLTKEQREHKSKMRAERIAHHGPEKTYNLRKRVEGFSGIV